MHTKAAGSKQDVLTPLRNAVSSQDWKILEMKEKLLVLPN